VYSRRRRYGLKLKGSIHSDNFDKGCFVPDVNVSKLHRKLNSFAFLLEIKRNQGIT